MQTKQPRHIYLALSSLALMIFIGILNETSMNVTYPRLAPYFHVSLGVIQWITTGYLLMVTITMGTTAYLLRQFTAKRLHLVAVLAFIIGDVMSATALAFPMLLTGRLLQAVATGLATPILYHLIFTEIPRQRLGAMTGFAGMVISFAPALGPTYGGFISEALSWRMIFWLLLPLALLSLIIGQLFIRNHPYGNDKPFSYGSLFALALALFVIVYDFSTLEQHGFDLAFWLFLIGGLLCFGLFAYINNHGRSQLFDLTIFRLKTLRLSTFTYFSLQFINIGISLVIPLYAQYVLHTSSTIAGLVLLPGSIIGALIASWAGRLADQQGFAKPVTFGGSLLLLGTVCFVAFQRQLTAWWLMIFFVILRIGFNFSFGNTISNATVQVDQRNTSDVNSVFNMVQQFGGSLGTGLLAAVISLKQKAGIGSLAVRTYAGGRIDYWLVTILAALVVLAIMINFHWQSQTARRQ
ncbi:MFS transporter [Limosilactobacillus sp.]|uniref:MFS transporter n=1 Tax=Limosilactobacillus sp. TaxID=2773925 RepID=UPI0035A103DE